MALALVGVQFVVKGLEAAAENIGGTALVAFEVLERGQDEGAFDLLQRGADRQLDQVAGSACALVRRRSVGMSCSLSVSSPSHRM